MIDITRALTTLATVRPIFHSEADFQHALAWKIHELTPTCSMRLEFKPPQVDRRIYVDVWATDDKVTTAIELKYKTRGLIVSVGGESFDLKDQSAQDVGKYEFLKDIQRLEEIISGRDVIVGYALFLTNDSAYWKLSRGKDTLDANFRIHGGRNITGELVWRTSESRGRWTVKMPPLIIRGAYELRWRDYSQLVDFSYGKFRYLLVKVGDEQSV